MESPSFLRVQRLVLEGGFRSSRKYCSLKKQKTFELNWKHGVVWSGIVFRFGQSIATSHDLTSKGSWGWEIPLFQGNLGWCLARYYCDMGQSHWSQYIITSDLVAAIFEMRQQDCPMRGITKTRLIVTMQILMMEKSPAKKKTSPKGFFPTCKWSGYSSRHLGRMSFPLKNTVEIRSGKVLQKIRQKIPCFWGEKVMKVITDVADKLAKKNEGRPFF